MGCQEDNCQDLVCYKTLPLSLPKQQNYVPFHYTRID